MDDFFHACVQTISLWQAYTVAYTVAEVCKACRKVLNNIGLILFIEFMQTDYRQHLEKS